MLRYRVAAALLILIHLYTCQLYAKSYIIDKTLDLNGQTLFLSKKDVLIFNENGQMLNGTVIGDYTLVKAPKKMVFKNVTLKGSFKSDMAYSDWFGIKSDCVLSNNKIYLSGTDNTQEFSNLLLFDNISIAPGQYMIKGSLRCRSNQTIDGNGSIIKCLNKGVCIRIDGMQTILVSNVTIKNITIIGGKNDFNDVTEFWDGIDIGFARNVLIENVNSEYCRGDGFYIGTSIGKVKDKRIPKDIKLLNVKAYHNHRQGLSITRARGVLIKNSEFCYTEGTPPQRGIDIEPNCRKCDDGSWNIGVCENIEIDSCVFRGNTVAGIVLFKVPDAINQNKFFIKGITIKNSIFDDDDIYVESGKNIKLENLILRNSVIGVVEKSAVNNLSISNISMEEDRMINGRNAIELDYTKNGALNNNIIIDRVHISGYGGAGIIFKTGDNVSKQYRNVSITNCNIIKCGRGIVTGNNVQKLKEKNNKVVTYSSFGCLFGGAFLLLGFVDVLGRHNRKDSK